jgi:CheY-like chemotaxis protein
MSAKGVRVLVVDDDAANRDVYAALLAREGFLVVSAADGREALTHLQRQAFDLLVTDMLMPNVDGVQLLDAVRQMARKPKVIAISGGGRYLGATQTLALARKLGAAATLVKPFTREQLLASVAEVLAR